jgi:hypothetical protein
MRLWPPLDTLRRDATQRSATILRAPVLAAMRAFLLSAAVSIAVPSVAHAQAQSATPESARPPTPIDQARLLFTRGVAALEEGVFADAAQAFEQSYRLNPAPVVQFNLGFAYRGLGRNLDAIEALERFLAQPGNTPAAQIAAGREELERLRATIVRLTLRLTADDSVVSAVRSVVAIDGHAPRMEASTLLCDPGHHVITATLDGYHPLRTEQDFAPGTTHVLPWNLAAITDQARLVIEPSVQGAVIEVDGVTAAQSPFDQRVRAGTHHVVVNAPGYLQFAREVQVGGTGVVRLSAVLRRPQASALWWAVPVIIVVGGAAITAGSIAIEYQVRRPLTPTPPNCLNCFMDGL